LPDARVFTTGSAVIGARALGAAGTLVWEGTVSACSCTGALGGGVLTVGVADTSAVGSAGGCTSCAEATESGSAATEESNRLAARRSGVECFVM
jgi:hypothetical protein